MVPPREEVADESIDTGVYERMWELKYGNAWVQDAGYGTFCISDKFYLAAATALFAAGKLERQWITGTDRYAYRLRDGNC